MITVYKKKTLPKRLFYSYHHNTDYKLIEFDKFKQDAGKTEPDWFSNWGSKTPTSY